MLAGLRRVALSLLALLLLAALALLSAWFLVDPSDYRAVINRHATEAVGQPVEMLGDMALTFSPLPTVAVEGIRVANPDGFEAAWFAELTSVRATVAPRELLRGNLAFTTVEADDVTIELERNQDGNSNWRAVADGLDANEDEPALAFSGIRSASVDTLTLNHADRQRGIRQRLVLQELSVEQLVRGGAGAVTTNWLTDGSVLGEAEGTLSGRFELSDTLEPQRLELTDLQTALTLPMDGADPLPLQVTALVELDLGGETANLSKLTVTGDELRAELDGELQWPSGGVTLSGAYVITDEAFRDRLRTVTGRDPEAEDPDALQRIHTAGSFEWQQQRLRLEEFRLELDDSTLEGHLDARFGDNPLWEFHAALDMIALDRYTPEVFDPDTVRAALEFILDAVPGIGLDGTLEFGAVEALGLELTDIRAQARSQGDELTISPLEATVYGGSYYGTFNIPLDGSPYSIWFEQRIEGMSLGEVLDTVVGWAVIEATADTQWSGFFTGMHWPDIRDSLQAEGSLALHDGQINRFSLRQMIEDAVPSALGGADHDPFTEDATTPFSRISGELEVADGVLENADARAASEYFVVGGSGKLDIAAVELDYDLELTMVEPFATESERLLELLMGVTIPLHLHGPLNSLEISYGFEDALGEDFPDEAD